MINHEVKFGWGEKWPAPAKLNLMLRIVGRRDDGYHLLQTVFQMTDLCDWLTFRPLAEDRVELTTPIPRVPAEDDLTVRAAYLLKKHTGYRLGVSIEVQKILPMGGGLGGGSSDAATTLVALNKLWRLNLAQEELMHLGLKLGADVPVFIFGETAWAEGVGEKLVSMQVPEKWVVIIKPTCNVNTKEIFLTESLTRDSKCIKMSDFIEGVAVNDCQSVVCSLYPEVAEAMKALSRFGEACLTGTGACVFALFENELDANLAYQSLKSDWQVFFAKTYNVSPLYKN